MTRIGSTGVLGPLGVSVPTATPGSAPAIALEPEWPQLWFSATEREWSSLVVVPGGAGVSSLDAARAFAEAGRLYRGHAVHLLDATGAGPAAASAIVAATEDVATHGEQVVIAVDWPLASHPAIHIARAAEAALLLVPLGKAALADVRRTVEFVGHGRFLGSITVRPTAGRARR